MNPVSASPVVHAVIDPAVNLPETDIHMAGIRTSEPVISDIVDVLSLFCFEPRLGRPVNVHPVVNAFLDAAAKVVQAHVPVLCLRKRGYFISFRLEWREMMRLLLELLSYLRFFPVWLGYLIIGRRHWPFGIVGIEGNRIPTCRNGCFREFFVHILKHVAVHGNEVETGKKITTKTRWPETGFFQFYLPGGRNRRPRHPDVVPQTVVRAHLLCGEIMFKLKR